MFVFGIFLLEINQIPSHLQIITANSLHCATESIFGISFQTPSTASRAHSLFLGSHLRRRRPGPHDGVDDMPGRPCRRLPIRVLGLKSASVSPSPRNALIWIWTLDRRWRQSLVRGVQAQESPSSYELISPSPIRRRPRKRQKPNKQ
jgi:hypothetical protein